MARLKEYGGESDWTARGSDAGADPCAPSLFDRPDWRDAMARHCLPDVPSLTLSARMDGVDALMALVETAPGQAIALANFYSFHWRPTFSVSADLPLRRRLVAAMARQLSDGVGHAALYPVLADAGDLDLLIGGFRDAGWIAIPRVMGCNHVLRLKGRSFADYWATRPGPLRSTVQRKGARSTLDLTIHHSVDDALWADYCAVYERSWKPREEHIAFLRAIAEQAAGRGELRLGFARTATGQPLATQFWTVEGGGAFRRALIHKLAHDAAFDRDSPGTLLSAHMFAQAIDGDHVAMIDYGTGDNPYKRDWMEEQRPLYRLDCFDPARPSSWLPAARTAISRLVGPRHRR